MSFDIKKVEIAMNGVLEHYNREFASLNVGKASADFLNSIQVEAYGQYMPIKQVATINVIDNFTLMVAPFDKNNIKTTAKAIQEANLGVGVIAEATSIRVTMPKITEERRKEYVKILKKYTEDGKIAIRGIRRDANDEIKTDKKNSEISEDIAKRLENDVQKLTDSFVNKLDEASEKKEAEILKV